MTLAVIGLGSNVGHREDYLSRAIAKLAPHMTQLKRSRVYQSPAMLPEGAPDEWDLPFLNMAIAGETSLAVPELLDVTQAVESTLGRRESERWGPREIDVDILLYGDSVWQSESLQIPHPGLIERSFVLKPLCDIVPNVLYPSPGIFFQKPIHEIAAHMRVEQDACCTPYPAAMIDHA